MNARLVTHPSADTLEAFGLGKLSDSTLADSVLQHLGTCADCRKKVTAVSGESILQGLSDARQRGDAPIPTRGVSEIGRAMNAAEQASTTPPEILDLPRELRKHPQYEVQRELGRGGMGVVYLAKNKLMARLEVLKVVNKKMLEQPGALDRFLREIRSAAHLSHPNVVSAHNALQLGELLVFAMEYVPGEDLAQVVKHYGSPLPVLNACYYVQQVVLGLQHAFEKGMVHRDIKPHNLILAKHDKKHIVKILDFGLAKARSEGETQHDLTGAGQMLGTPDYMAPEQWRDAANADTRADIYSLGCTLYFLLSGHAPFKGSSLLEIWEAHQSRIAKPLNEVRPEVPVELAAVVTKMMAKNPAERYQKPIEVAQALLPFLKAPRKVASSASSPRTAAAVDQEKAPPQGLVEAIAEAVRQETVPEGCSTTGQARKRPATRLAQPSAAFPAAKRKWLLVGAGIAAVLFLTLVGLWASGVFKLKTRDGTIVLEDLPDNAEVLVDGTIVTFKTREGKTAEISATAATTHQLQVRCAGFKIFGQEVEVDAGGRRPIRVRLEPLLQQAQQPIPDKETRPSTVNRTPSFIDGGPWRVQGDELVQTDSKPGFSLLVFGDPEWDDYDFSVDAMCVGGDIRIQLALFVRFTTDFYLFGLFRNSCQLEFQSPLKTLATYNVGLVNGIWYTVRVRVRGNLIQCFLKNGEKELLVFNFEDDGSHPKGRVALRTSWAAFRFKNIRVTAPDGKVLWEGVPSLSAGDE